MSPKEWGAPRQAAMGVQIWFPGKRCGCLTFPLCLLFSENLSSEQATEMENMKSLVYRLFTALHLEEFQKKREHHLLEKIDHLKGQLQPLEQVWKHLN